MANDLDHRLDYDAMVLGECMVDGLTYAAIQHWCLSIASISEGYSHLIQEDELAQIMQELNSTVIEVHSLEDNSALRGNDKESLGISMGQFRLDEDYMQYVEAFGRRVVSKRLHDHMAKDQPDWCGEVDVRSELSNHCKRIYYGDDYYDWHMERQYAEGPESAALEYILERSYEYRPGLLLEEDPDHFWVWYKDLVSNVTHWCGCIQDVEMVESRSP